MKVRDRSSVLLLATLLVTAGASPAPAAVDVTGRWGLVVESSFIGPQPSEWDFEQTGTTIVLTITFTGSTVSGTVGPYPGTIDPDTGVFHVDLPDAPSYPPFPPCPDSRIDGTATPDSQAIGGVYSSYFFDPSPYYLDCENGFGPYNGVRCGPGVAECCPGPSCCGNG